MAADLDALRALRLVARQTLTPRDAMLYALGVGLGADPLDEAQLRFVYEDGLQALPTLAITLTYPDLLAAYVRAGAEAARVLHGEQQFQLHGPLPTGAELEGETRVLGLVDKGPGRGLLVYNRTEVRDVDRGRAVATLTSSSFLLDEGGRGGDAFTSPIELPPLPARAPDAVCDLPTLPQAALIYRLSGDWNPLHALPRVARAAGHPRPLLHGRCSYGVAGHAILRTIGYDAARLTGMAARFTAPVYPGETLRTDIWHGGGSDVRFRTRVVGRDAVALDRGVATLA
ncbi:MAG: MaoC/PaaZ C-terminal domain-containing protein [Rubrivivax sp.]